MNNDLVARLESSRREMRGLDSHWDATVIMARTANAIKEDLEKALLGPGELLWPSIIATMNIASEI